MHCKGKVRAVELNGSTEESEHYEWMHRYMDGYIVRLMDQFMQCDVSVQSSFIPAYMKLPLECGLINIYLYMHF